MKSLLSMLMVDRLQIPFHLTQCRCNRLTNDIAKGRGISDSMWGISCILVFLLSVSLMSCAPQKKHDHAIFGPTDKGNGTQYDNNNP
jgi:hypothetical protein